MSNIIDGKALALKHEEALKVKVSELSIRPKLVSILIGEDPKSLKYTEMKEKKASEIGLQFTIQRFPAQTDNSQIIENIHKLNEDPQVNGIMIQLPAPEGLVDEIDPKKDVDGLTGKGKFMQATVRGVISILENAELRMQNAEVAVVGAEGFVGKGIVKALEERGAKVIRIDKGKAESGKGEVSTELNDCQKADVVISCTGVNDLIKPEHIKKGAILIDVGLGDFDESCYEKSSAYTPKVGGVGPMTVISLMKNLVDSVG